MRVLAAMSGGVDSSVAAALLLDMGHEVTGVTLRLWGGESDSGCCSVADVDDARRVARTLGIVHHVIDDSELFMDRVVMPYIRAHAGGVTPNPCIECNRHIKFGSLLERARRLGYDAIATGHYAKVERLEDDSYVLLRGNDPLKDQSYVLSSLTQDQLRSLLLPLGDMHKSKVREKAASLGLSTAGKPDSLDVCFINSREGRGNFLAKYTDLHEGEIVDSSTGKTIGRVDAVELVTPGQRKGLGLSGGRRYALSVDVAARKVIVGSAGQAYEAGLQLKDITWTTQGRVDEHLGGMRFGATEEGQCTQGRGGEYLDGKRVLVQTSAHGKVRNAMYRDGLVIYDEPERLVSPGQTVAFYSYDFPDMVLGSGIVERGISAEETERQFSQLESSVDISSVDIKPVDTSLVDV